MEEMKAFGSAGEELVEKLSGAREQLGLSLDAVSESTNIRKEFLESIEAGDLTLLPSVYVHVFLRKYARAVGIVEDDLIERCRREIGMPDAASFMQSDGSGVRDEELSGSRDADLQPASGSDGEEGAGGRLAEMVKSVATEGIRIPPAGVIGGGAALIALLLFAVLRSFQGSQETGPQDAGSALSGRPGGVDSAGVTDGEARAVQERFEKELEELSQSIREQKKTVQPVRKASPKKPVSGEEAPAADRKNTKVAKEPPLEPPAVPAQQEPDLKVATAAGAESLSEPREIAEEQAAAVKEDGNGIGESSGTEEREAVPADDLDGTATSPFEALPEVSPTLDRQRQPRYPALARDAGIGGKVFVTVLIGSDGKPLKARVTRRVPADQTVFDDAAIDAVMRSSYSPGMRGGDPVEAWLTVPIRFATR